MSNFRNLTRCVKPIKCERAANRPPFLYATAPCGALRAHFLALEDDIAQDEQQDRAGDEAHDLRPGDDQALAKRHWRAKHRTLELAQVHWSERARGRIEDRHHHLTE